MRMQMPVIARDARLGVGRKSRPRDASELNAISRVKLGSRCLPIHWLKNVIHFGVHWIRGPACVWMRSEEVSAFLFKFRIMLEPSH